MKDEIIRKQLIEILKDAGVLLFPNEDRLSLFIYDGVDIVLNEFEIESLTAMEVCIGIELELGVSIVPEQLSKFDSLKQLLDEILKLEKC